MLVVAPHADGKTLLLADEGVWHGSDGADFVCAFCSIRALTMYEKHHLLIPCLYWCLAAIPNLTTLENSFGNLVLVETMFLMMWTLIESNN